MKYQVILMDGPNEPWWFFENWQDDIIWEQSFATLQDARKCYREKYQELAMKYSNIREKNLYQVAFWDNSELYYCDDCDDETQLYHGLLITENGTAIK